MSDVELRGRLFEFLKSAYTLPSEFVLLLRKSPWGASFIDGLPADPDRTSKSGFFDDVAQKLVGHGLVRDEEFWRALRADRRERSDEIIDLAWSFGVALVDDPPNRPILNPPLRRWLFDHRGVLVWFFIIPALVSLAVYAGNLADDARLLIALHAGQATFALLATLCFAAWRDPKRLDLFGANAGCVNLWSQLHDAKKSKDRRWLSALGLGPDDDAAMAPWAQAAQRARTQTRWAWISLFFAWVLLYFSLIGSPLLLDDPQASDPTSSAPQAGAVAEPAGAASPNATNAASESAPGVATIEPGERQGARALTPEVQGRLVMQVKQSVLVRFFNDLASVALFSAFWVLTFVTVKFSEITGEEEQPRFIDAQVVGFIIAIGILFCHAIAVLRDPGLAMAADFWFRLLSGFVSAVATAMLAGRLDSALFGVRWWILVPLYLYAAIQPCFAFDQFALEWAFRHALSPEVQSVLHTVQFVLYIYALAAKYLLFLVFAWIYHTGRLDFYLLRARRLHSNLAADWRRLTRPAGTIPPVAPPG